MLDNKQLFDFMLERVHDVGVTNGLKDPQAFGRWFAEMYFPSPREFFIPDGSGDGKVDLFFGISNGDGTEHCVLNTKFTKTYSASAPVSFYDEVTRFWQAFANKGSRPEYLNSVVRLDVRRHYQKLFQHYDNGRAGLFFLTNSKKNENQARSLEQANVKIFHLEDVLQFMVDYIEDAMPRTSPLLLTGISTVLSAAAADSTVPTSIVFARLSDFIQYMHRDPYDLLFARNVRLSLGNTPVNTEIRTTFVNAPKEFVFSNNGITIICERLEHDPGSHEVIVHNPRIVNGSQTLHSIRDVARPNDTARVMTRIIQIPPVGPKDIAKNALDRKSIIDKISVRSNRQNNIKKWDLISNDDFQHDLARFFRSKGLYYERRRNEWSYRRTELKSLRVKRGPDSKSMAQLIASYHWDSDLLGPVAAKSLTGLFEGKPYEQISKADPELAYQLFLLISILDACALKLGKHIKYVGNIRGHARFALFSLVVRALQRSNAAWGSPSLTAKLDMQQEAAENAWQAMTRQALQLINQTYRAAAQQMDRGQVLPYANFFKSRVYMAKLFGKPLPKGLIQAARRVLNSVSA